MGILAPSADERVRDVRIDADTLSVALMDGRTISVPLAGSRGYWMPRRHSAPAGSLPAPATVSTGPNSTRT